MRNHRKTIIILLLLFTNRDFSQVAQPIFNLVRGTNSFTLGKVGSIAQDKYGYMWFADQANGCFARYDGYHMKIFKHDPRDSNSTNCRDFECIAADASGNIWAGTPDGIDKFDLATNKFIHYRYPKGEQGSGADAIIFDHKGIVWMGGGGGLSSLDPTTGKFTFYRHKDNDTSSLSSNIVRSLCVDKTGRLWVGTGFPFDVNTKEGGLNKFNEKNGTFTRYMHDPNNPQSLISNKVRAMLEDSKGNFWVGTDGDGLHIMNREKGTFERLAYDPLHPEKLSRPPIKKGEDYDHITFIREDRTGKIWIGTYAQGIIVYDPITKIIQHFTSDDKKRAGGYTDNSTWATCISKEGEIWISNEHHELYRIDPFQTGFSEVKMNGSVNHFFEDTSGNLWIATGDHGLVMVNPKTNIKKEYLHNPNDSFSISSNILAFIQQRKDKQLWIGSWNGLNLFNPQTSRFTKYFYNPASKDQGQDTTGVFELLETETEIYFGAYRGLNVKSKNSGIITHYVNNPLDSNSISAGGVVSFFNKGDGNIWMSVWNGDGAALELFNTKTKQFKHYLKGLIVWDIFKSSNSKMWVGTSNGLYYRNDSSDSFIQVGPETAEFRKTRVKSMTEDRDKNIWGVSSLGIFRLFGDRFGTFDVGALPYAPSFRASNGELFFGNPHGYYKCFADNTFNQQPAQIEITDFKINGVSVMPYNEKILKGPIEESEEITIRHDQNKFSVDFAGIHFSDPENNIHQYMLDGYEIDWREAREEKAVNYFNVPTGHYVFRIKVASSYGVIAEKSIRIIVLPPWWQTWWAYTLYLLLLALAIWVFIRWRTRTLQKEKDILETKVALRTKELQQEKAVVEITLTELKSTQNQLIQSEKMASLGELTAGIAHEIQNPLNFVNNFSELNSELIAEMKQEIDKGNMEDVRLIASDIDENQKKILFHGQRAGSIVKSMLQHSRTSKGMKEPTDINALCDEYLHIAYHGLRAKDKSFNALMKTNFAENIENIYVIPQDIGRVLLNLYNNAFYAVTEKNKQQPENYEPTISVSTKKLTNNIEIKVRDNGNGITQKVIDKIFQPFFTTKPTGQGTGLGLSLSYDIIKAHNGELKVDTKEGEYSEFTVLFPG